MPPKPQDRIPKGIEIVPLDSTTAPMLLGTTVFDNGVDATQLEAFVRDLGHMLVFARDDQTVAGFASGNRVLHPDKPPAFFLNEVGVLPEYRRRGIATALCQHLIDMARVAGCSGIWLATEAENTAARALYRALGGRETKDIVVWDWDDAMTT